MPNFGNSASLRDVARALHNGSEDTSHLHARITHGTAGLLGTVSAYERRAAASFVGRWDGVGAVIQRLVHDSDDVAGALTALAAALDRCQQRWSLAESAAWNAGFTVTQSPLNVTAPTGASDADNSHALQLLHDLSAALAEASSARRVALDVIDRAATHGPKEFAAGRRPGLWVTTGDAGLDARIEAVAAPLLAAHAGITGGN